MNVIWAENQEITFDSVKPGDCFIKNNFIYIKTSDCRYAVNLTTGYLTRFNIDDTVIPTYAEVFATKGENNE